MQQPAGDRRKPRGAKAARREHNQGLSLEVLRAVTDPDVEILAHRPTTAEPGSVERILAYARRIHCGLPIFNPGDAPRPGDRPENGQR